MAEGFRSFANGTPFLTDLDRVSGDAAEHGSENVDEIEANTACMVCSDKFEELVRAVFDKTSLKRWVFQ